MNTEQEPRRARIRRCSRGAVLIVGLTWGLWFTFGLHSLLHLAEASLDQLSKQDGVDSAALSNAVWQAQGLNAATRLNGAGAVLTSLLVAWRLAFVSHLLTALVSLVGTGPITDGLEVSHSGLSHLVEADSRISDGIGGLLADLTEAQVLLVGQTPLLATELPSSVRDRYGVALGSLSTSLAPVLVQAGGKTTPGGPGLPLSPGENMVPCRTASTASQMQREAAALLPPSRLQPGEGGEVSKLVGLPRGADVVEFLSKRGSRGLYWSQAWCSPASELFERAKAAAWSAAREWNVPVKDFEVLQRVNESLRALEYREVGLTSHRYSPLYVSKEAKNGSEEFQSYGFSSTPRRLISADQATSPEGAAVGKEPWSTAEAYFDCAGPWKDCVGAATWQPRWQARLRMPLPLDDLLGLSRAEALVTRRIELGRRP